MEFIWPFFKLGILLHKIIEKNSIQIFSEKNEWTMFISFEICVIYLIEKTFFLFCYEKLEAPIHVVSCSKPPSFVLLPYALHRWGKAEALPQQRKAICKEQIRKMQKKTNEPWWDRNYQCLHTNEKKENNRKNCKNKEMAKIYQMKKLLIFLFEK